MRIFVGNVPFATSEEDLVQLFNVYGTVDRVQIATDRKTGRARGFAFVEMPDASEAREAIAELNGAEVGGRPLTVNEARPRAGEPRPGARRA
jgi:RNA recognition motif-containing protein